MRSGVILRQEAGFSFKDIELHNIEEMWLDGLENVTLNRRICPGFSEFIFFESAVVSGDELKKVAEFIGWTNGQTEFLAGISREKHCFHPQSRLK